MNNIVVHSPVRSRTGHKSRQISINGRHVPGLEAVAFQDSHYSIYSGSVLLASAIPGRQIEYKVAELLRDNKIQA